MCKMDKSIRGLNTRQKLLLVCSDVFQRISALNFESLNLGVQQKASGGWMSTAQLRLSSVKNVGAIDLSVTPLKSFNPFGVESPDGA